MYKLYDFPWSVTGQANGASVPAARIAFSSYPSCLFSMDDFYTLSSGLAVTETTIQNANASLWSFVQPSTVPEWARNMVANRLVCTARGGVVLLPPFCDLHYLRLCAGY